MFLRLKFRPISDDTDEMIPPIANANIVRGIAAAMVALAS